MHDPAFRALWPLFLTASGGALLVFGISAVKGIRIRLDLWRRQREARATRRSPEAINDELHRGARALDRARVAEWEAKRPRCYDAKLAQLEREA